MWSYNKTFNGYKITNTSEYTSLSFNLPYEQEYPDSIMYWTEDTVKCLVDGLNDGSIPFHLNSSICFKDNVPCFNFSFKIPEEHELNNTLVIDKVTLK